MGAIERRDLLKFLGLGLGLGSVGNALTGRLANASAAPGSGSGPGPEAASALRPQGPATAAAPAPWWLVSPYEAGSLVLTARMTRMELDDEALHLELTGAAGRFRVDVCRRDEQSGAPRPICNTRRYDLFLANGGDGRTRTDPDQGRVVLALKDAIELNEMGRDPVPVLTMRQIWERGGT